MKRKTRDYKANISASESKSLFSLHLNSGISKLKWKGNSGGENGYTYSLSCYIINENRCQLSFTVTIFSLHFLICRIFFMPSVLLSIHLIFHSVPSALYILIIFKLWRVFFNSYLFFVVNSSILTTEVLQVINRFFVET